MSTKPRTPEHFPKMKRRGAGRRRRNEFNSGWDAFLSSVTSFAEGVMKAFENFGELITKAVEQVEAFLIGARREIETMPPAERAHYLATASPEDRHLLAEEFALIPPMKELTR